MIHIMNVAFFNVRLFTKCKFIIMIIIITFIDQKTHTNDNKVIVDITQLPNII